MTESPTIRWSIINSSMEVSWNGGYPQIIRFFDGKSPWNHPALVVPPIPGNPNSEVVMRHHSICWIRSLLIHTSSTPFNQSIDEVWPKERHRHQSLRVQCLVFAARTLIFSPRFFEWFHQKKPTFSKAYLPGSVLLSGGYFLIRLEIDSF